VSKRSKARPALNPSKSPAASGSGTKRRGSSVAWLVGLGVLVASGVVFCAFVRPGRVSTDSALHPAASISNERPYQPRPPGEINFNRHIAPIVWQQCAGCHREKGGAPFPLLSYAQAKARARDIAKVTQSRYMPPWLPEGGVVAFADERRLTLEQIGLIQQWVAEGSPEGPAGELPPLPAWSDEWQLGRPDLVAELPEPYTLPPDGRDVYRNFVLPMGLKEKRYVKAVEFKANTRVLHHVFIRFDRTRQSRRLDAQDTETGFGGMALPPAVESPGGYFLSWQPGRGPVRSRPGLSWAIQPGSDIVLQAHMQPSGKPERVQPSVAFYFTDEIPTNSPFKIGLSSFELDIPAGAHNYERRDSYVLPVNAQVLAVLPHTHYLGREVEGYAVLPDGRKQWLLKIHQWDFNWQSDYRYREPVSLPKGSRVEMRMTFDNSSENPRNPNQPPVRVKYGLQSSDEMAELWLQLLPENAQDGIRLEEDYARRLVEDIIAFQSRMLEQNPTNAHAHAQLAKALLSRRQLAEGLAHLRQAVQIDPNYEEAHYHLGVLAQDSDPAVAEAEFNRTIQINPENFKARNNLGLLFMRQGRLMEAEEQFQAALQVNPGDRTVMGNLELLRRAQTGK
jgi:tetratricopeptide (TPR) repeat protein